MKYVYNKRTNYNFSEIGLGCEGFIGKDFIAVKEMIDYAIENGVNCMDFYSPNPEMQKYVGMAIGDRRKNFIYQAHVCTKWVNGQYSATRNLEEVKFNFEQLLKNLNTDYVDIGMLHYIDSFKTWDEVVNNGILDYCKELKEKGIIKSIGMSSHHPEVALKVVKEGLIDILMFSVNPCYDLLPGDEDCDNLFNKDSYNRDFVNFDPMRVALYEECERQGVGITVMKAYAGGELLSDDSPAKVKMTVNECISYALSRPSVVSVLVGAHSLAELKDAINYENASEEEKDYVKKFKLFPRINWDGYCMYCGHCAPCSKEIDIAMVTKLLNLAISEGKVLETVRQHYYSLEHNASKCVECGLCMNRCPFNVDIIGNMKKAQKTFR